MKVLVTGAAGFIGYHVAARLLARGDEVVGLDNLNAYYDPSLKQARLDRLVGKPGFTFVKGDVADRPRMDELFRVQGFDRVVHLAAQAGVRHSLKDPFAYVNSNVLGFLTVLEGCRHMKVEHLVYASSSSVYGANTRMPFREQDPAVHPLSLYGATKRANELMAHSYSHLYALPTTGLRFFTVYGPWGRPDMAMFLFARAILGDEPLNVFNHGQMQRDFTYIDDIAEGVIHSLDRPATPAPEWSSDDPNPATSAAPYRVYNIGNNKPEPLHRVIELLEQHLGKKAQQRLLPMQPGDVPATYADIDALSQDAGFRAGTPIEVGVQRFVEWYLEFYGAGVVSA